jgi:hypothetical protein
MLLWAVPLALFQGCGDTSSLQLASVQQSETQRASDLGHTTPTVVHAQHPEIEPQLEAAQPDAPAASRSESPVAAAPPPVMPPSASAAGSPSTPIPDAGLDERAPEGLDSISPPTTWFGAPAFSTVELDDGTSLPQIGHGDLWPSCWGDDDALYVAAGDGRGFGLFTQDIIVGVVEGMPGQENYRGRQLAGSNAVSDVWSGYEYNRKPTGMLCLEGDLYLAVQDLRRETFSDAPAATIVRSSDKGRTWTWDRSTPMFDDHVWTTIMFLDYGKDSEHAPSDFIYAYGLDDNWAFSDLGPGPTRLYLARVPREHVQTRARWEFFGGIGPTGQPIWSEDIGRRMPVLEDTRRLLSMPLDPKLRFQNMTAINQGGVVYNAPLGRYLFSTWTEYTFELYEAPNPWGPFRLFHSKDFGVWPWDDARNGGYGTTIPSKYISEDGKHMLVQANSWSDITGKDNYSFSLRALHVEPYRASWIDNPRGPMNLATLEQGTVRVVRAARNARAQVMNDDDLTGADEDSHNGEQKNHDYWGYTWPSAHYVNTLRYTTGAQHTDGGYFDKLGVQARIGTSWIDIAVKDVEPEYPGTAETPAFATYTLRFSTVLTDGIRIHGRPGGSEHYTTIAELSVHHE